jgi:Outer membrane protein beta-barrel family/Carboxypeptidase regulatory-like domain
MKKLILLLLLIISTGFAFAQQVKVSGTVKDNVLGGKVKNAVIVLLTPKDSILKKFTRAKEDGSYVLENVKPGKYILVVSHPSFGDYVDDIEVKNENTTLPIVALTSKIKLLEAVIVKSGNAIRIKGDTTIYTADSFKVAANANVEELLKKMPGIQVDKNGEIKAMGQKVEKILVDGEEFFGDDPGMAVKNLRADAVKEVQVFDKKSEQAEFTGIDDGKTKKTINLKLKEDKKKGYFGKVDVAGGINNQFGNRFNDNILFGSFKGKRKLNAFVLNGNTGQGGLGWQDEQKYGGGENDFNMFDEDGGFVMFGGNNSAGDEEPYIDPNNGYLTSTNAGISYINKLNAGKTSVNISPRFTEQRYNNNENSFSLNVIKDTLINTNAGEIKNIDRRNLKAKGIFDFKLDSARTTLKVTATSNFYKTKSSIYKTSASTSTIGTKNTFTNSYTSNNDLNSDKNSFGVTAVLKYKFKKARRTLTNTTSLYQLNTQGESTLKSNNIFANIPLPTVINQEKDFDKVNNKISTNIVYTEPLTKKFALELGYSLSLTKDANDQTTLNYDSVAQKYNTKIDSLSNMFRQTIIQNIPSAKLNYAHKKFKVNVGAGVSFVNFDLKDLSSSIINKRDYTNFTPTANLSYAYKSNHNLSINYRGRTQQPSINQLQPLRNNTDLFNLYIGNPDLKPSFTNSFSVNHSGYNFIKDFWNYQSISLNVTNNAIANNRVTNTLTNQTKIQPVNTNGNVYLNFWGGFGTKLKKLDLRVGANINAGYNKYVDLINSNKVSTNNTNAGFSFDVNKSKDKKYDVGVSVGTNYNVQSTTQGTFKNQYFTNDIGFNGTIYLKKVWSLSSNYNFFGRQKTAQSPANNINKWNARLQRTFKKDEYTTYFAVNDILNQNNGFSRTFGQNASFTETTQNTLRRYWMVGFTWNFKNKAPVKK